MSGQFRPGDEQILNPRQGRQRFNASGQVECFLCRNWLSPDQFHRSGRNQQFGAPLKSYCLACDKTRKVRDEERKRLAVPSKVVQIPRDRPPSADAARQLRAVLDDIGRSLSRLESLAAGHQLTQIGDEAERRTLASQLLRLANAATDLTGRLSGITTGGGHENHERSAEIRNIR